MGLETATFISDLNIANPLGGDAKNQGDDHIRLIKSTLKTTYPNVTGAVTPTHTELNYMVGVTSAIQTQFGTKGAISGQTWTGTHAFASTTSIGTVTAAEILTLSGVTSPIQTQMNLKAPLASPTFTGPVTVPTPTNVTDAATKGYADSLSMTAGNLPVGGTTGQMLKKNSATNYDTSWFTLTSGIARSARTANTILGTADSGTFIDVTSGTFTQTFTAAATLATGWYCYVRNSGTGDITLDPNASELIDGLTSYVSYSGETRLIQCNGTAFTTVVLSPFNRTFTGSGTFITPPGYSYFGGLLWGAGASGNRNNNAAAAVQGGGGGGCGDFTFPSSAMGASISVLIGAGGAPQTATGFNVGGDTSLGSLMTVYGAISGGGGAISTNLINLGSGVAGRVVTGYEGATPTSFAVVNSAIWGGAASGIADASLGASGSSIWGGAAGGAVSATATVTSAGTSKFAGNGGAAASATNGAAGTAPGGGGGATQTGTQSGAGARGELRIWGIA